MNYAQRALLLISTALLLGLLAGCGQSQVQLGWIESNQPGHFRASYAMFSGSKVRRARAGAGETLVLQYDAKVDQGALAIRVEDPDEAVLWDVSVQENAGETVELFLRQDGLYSIVIQGDGTGGSFDVTWKLE